ncbi:MAG: AraC family transcriptional regulator [Bacteroidia bacterium]|nr:AraC family transcriptional regulator [Bacteroidia bacterium]
MSMLPEPAAAEPAVLSVTELEPGLSLGLLPAQQEPEPHFLLHAPKGVVQLYCCAEGAVRFRVLPGQYELTLGRERCYLMYNPAQDLHFALSVQPHSRMAWLHLSVEKLHKLFVPELDSLHFLRSDSLNKRFYAEQAAQPSLSAVIFQLSHVAVSPVVRPVYLRAKALELISLFLNPEEGQHDACPFLQDTANIDKIRLARRILQERMLHPPTIPELAREIGLNEFQLKAGFKNIYGDTVYNYLMEYRMQVARKLLDSGQHKVNEASYAVGYANPSHFIAAFRKKFGITPKKYLMSLQRA